MAPYRAASRGRSSTQAEAANIRAKPRAKPMCRRGSAGESASTRHTHLCSVPPAHRDHGEVRIGQEIFADRALLLEQIESRAALLALAHWNRIDHGIDADKLLDILLEL